MPEENLEESNLQEIHQSIVNNYKELLDPNSDQEIQAYRYLLYGNVYTGKYKARPLASMGYAEQYEKAKPFLELINRLALTHKELFEEFVQAWEKQEDYIDVLLKIFDDLNKNTYTHLNAKIEEKRNELAIKIAENEETNEKTNDFIKKIIYFRPQNKNNDYFELKKFIENRLANSATLRDNLSKADILDICTLRTTCQEEEQKATNQLKLLKKSINHFALSLNTESLCETRRIKTIKRRNAFSSKYSINGTLTPELLQEKNRIKAQKKTHLYIAKSVGTNVAAGEGTVAGVSMLAFLIAIGVSNPISLALGILTGISGAVCNYYLVRDDTYEMLNAIRTKKLFAEITGVKRDAAVLFGSGSLATGFVYASLSAMSLYHGLLMPVFSSLHISGLTATILGTTLACFPVGFTAIGLASIFFYVIADFIKNERWIDIKAYFYRNYFDLGWSHMSHGERFKTVLSCLGKLSRLLIALAINVVITIISLGVFHKQGVKLLTIFLNTKLANSLASDLASTNAVISFFFGMQKINEFLKQITLKSACINLALLIPYHIPKLLYLIIDAALTGITYLPLLFANILGFIPKLLTNLATHPLQLLIGLVVFIIEKFLDLPKNIMSFPVIMVALSAYILSALFELIRAPISLSARVIETTLSLLSRAFGKSLDLNLFHEAVDTAFCFFSSSLQSLGKNALIYTADISNTLDLTTAKAWLNLKTTQLTNKLTDFRHEKNNWINQYFSQPLQKIAQRIPEMLTNHNVCYNIFNATFETLKKSLYQATHLDYDQSNKKIDAHPTPNRIQKAVLFFGKKTVEVAKASTGCNAMGQSALMMGGAKGLGDVLGNQTAGAVIAASVEFPYSAAPNAMAIDKSGQKDFAVHPAKTSEHGLRF